VTQFSCRFKRAISEPLSTSIVALQDQADKAGLPRYAASCCARPRKSVDWPTRADAHSRRYFYLFLPHHLAEAGESAQLLKSVKGFLRAGICRLGDCDASSDYESLPHHLFQHSDGMH